MYPSRVYVLNLDRDPDRIASVKASIAASEILRNVPIIRWRATPISEIIVPDWWRHRPDTYAVGEDHLRIIQTAYVEGCESALVLEDDALLAPDFDAMHDYVMRMLPKNWMGVWWGRNFWGQIPPIRIAPDVVRLRGSFDMHAYLLNRAGMHRVYSHCRHEFMRIIDNATHQLHGIEPHFYAPARPTVYQFSRRNGDQLPVAWWKGGPDGPAPQELLDLLHRDVPAGREEVAWNVNQVTDRSRYYFGPQQPGIGWSELAMWSHGKLFEREDCTSSSFSRADRR